ncbi:hypothetical protein B0A52_04108 [Exophiala mesophila]|uniref:U3 small nucleolar RNA-associated protein 10 n=1 Tax=Exophiala mesophila TaxID=212818 RepID=A0A438NAA9_EXOME|nr:hypothetical protein B0A52_04108 [Exophiala mesophila]
MASAFASQLRAIAANSSHELDLKARREAHAQSLIFDQSVAVKQDWDTIYQVCLDGFQELCLLDSRLKEFDNNLFSPHSKEQDRDQLTKSQNDALSLVIERCLALIGAKVLLRPGIKAVEWLVRRFRAHVLDTTALLCTFLPYHESPVFRNILSLIPANKITNDWKFLGPYHKNAASVPRHVIVYSATHNDAFFSTFNSYVLRACEDGGSQTQLLRFWGSLVVEAITGRLQQTKSGRAEVQKQRQADALLKILPVLIGGFEIRTCPEMTICCFTISIVLASNAMLDDTVIDSLADAVVSFLNANETEIDSVLTSLSVLITNKSEKKVPKSVLRDLTSLADLHERLVHLLPRAPVAGLLEALLSSSLVGLRKKNFGTRLEYVSSALTRSSDILDGSALSRVLVRLLQKVESLDPTDAVEAAIRARILTILQNAADSPRLSGLLAEAAIATGKSLADLELIVGTTLVGRSQSQSRDASSNDQVPETLVKESQTAVIESVLASLPATISENSFIVAPEPVFEEFANAYASCYMSHSNLQKFQALALWSSNLSTAPALYESFVLRLACSIAPGDQRAAALLTLPTRPHFDSEDLHQLLLPYLTILLTDASRPVRQAASSVTIAIRSSASQSQQPDKATSSSLDTLQDTFTSAEIRRIPHGNILKILDQAYLPVLEECVLDASQMGKVLQIALDSTSPSSSSGPKVHMELKKSLRQNLFDLLATFATVCPLIKAKVAVVELLVGVNKVSSTTSARALASVLKDWSDLTAADAAQATVATGLSISDVDDILVQLIRPSDKEAVDRILDMVESADATVRPELTAAFFNRIALVWKDLRTDAQLSASTRLFNMAFSKRAAVATGSRHVLLTNPLSTEILATLLDFASSGLAQLQSEGPAKKRRRTSHGRESLSKHVVVEFESAISRLTFALEIVDSSKPETHPGLLNDLFEGLVTLRRIKDRGTSESPYLLTLCLSSILAIVQKSLTLRKPNIDISAIRADLITDCVRSSDNPQVQTTALLLAASVASIAPDRILHNIMPIFTFTGHNLFAKEDDRSVFVTNQAIDQIIPPLVASLKKQDATNLIDATSSLLVSFVAAYDHIPQHRRVAFYHRLLNRLGADDFAFAIIALLRSRRPTDDIRKFLTDLVDDLPAKSQLITYQKLTGLSSDIFEAKPQHVEALLGINASSSNEKKEKSAALILGVASGLLESNGLKTQLRRIRKFNAAVAEELRGLYRTCIPQTLSFLKKAKEQQPNVLPAVRSCLHTLLELPSIADLLNLVPSLLLELQKLEDHDLQPLALRVLASQLQHNAARDTHTRSEAIAFLPVLGDLITSTENEALRHASISCIDRIVEVYGRKSPEAVLAASTILVEGEHGLSSKDPRTQLMSLLCLASMMEALKESAIPLVPTSMAKSIAILEYTLQDKGRGVDLHNAVFALLSALIAHVPFMLSDDNVVDMLKMTYKSSVKILDGSSQEARKDALTLLAHKLEIGTITSSLTAALPDVLVEFDDEGVAQLLDVLLQAIERNSKSVVVQSSDAISNLLLRILDMHRLLPSSKSVSAVSAKMNSISIAFIYKLNNTIFQPIFETWIDWATKGTDLVDDNFSPAAKTARLTSLFDLLTHFFSSLKSIVTSYTAYILEPANTVLSTMYASATDEKSEIMADELALYTSTLHMLTAALSHDQGTIDEGSQDADDPGFFTRHFEPLATNLLQQLTLNGAKDKSLRKVVSALVPRTIIALATATMDTPSRHQTINHALCQLRHHDNTGVRLAGIRMNLAITEDEVVGDEWINNIVVGSSGEGGVGGAGETMVYVNEALEDDDEEVEREVRRWVRLVREKVGEDVFEI